MIFENEIDVTNETIFKDKLRVLWNCDFMKLPINYSLDFACMRGKDILAWLELKCRKITSYKYQSTMINLDKWIHSLQLIEYTGLPVFLAVRFTDCDMFCEISRDLKYNIVFQKQPLKSRIYRNDIAPKILISLKQFQQI